MSEDFSGKVVLVAGASKGIGVATARAFAAAGAAVVLAARSSDSLVMLAEEIERAGGRALPVTADVGDVASMQNLVAQTIDRFGRLDFAFNNATDGPMPAPLHEIDRMPLIAVSEPIFVAPSSG